MLRLAPAVAAAALVGSYQAFADAPGKCSEARALSAVGERYSPELGERVARTAGARVVREVERGRAYTMEFSPDRLNLEVDHRGVIIAARCG